MALIDEGVICPWKPIKLISWPVYVPSQTIPPTSPSRLSMASSTAGVKILGKRIRDKRNVGSPRRKGRKKADYGKKGGEQARKIIGYKKRKKKKE